MFGLSSLVIAVLVLGLQVMNNRFKVFINFGLVLICVYGYSIIDFEVLRVLLCGTVVMISHALDTTKIKSVKRGKRG